ncbi:pilus assembly protein [Caulobacter sp. BE254]|uniref:pilus assembly protein n=1 Tax=Caulobacter sp. BE254 TaxID=2817720 RepID=UPI002864E192|nr:pilus assembly protein [Caulobacter sp. BE254]MDR7117176.1 Flp pilus assembly protein TadG [Caulobacter sp. BE254]
MTMWKRLAARLRDDERGAIAVQFALLLIPIAILTFGLVDLSRASLQKRQLQDALDAATLMAARSTATTNADLDAVGDAALATEMAGLGVPLTAANSTFTLGDNNTVVGAIQNVTIKPIISNLWSTGDANVSAGATVMRSVNKLEVALVLDNTGSMGDTLGSGEKKIDALIRSSKMMVTTLAAAAASATEDDAVKLAVVPFSMTVNVGAANKGAAWIQGTLPTEYGTGTDLFDGTPRADRFTLLSNMGATWGGCVESRPAPFDVTDAAATGTNKASLFVPFFAPDEPDKSYTVKKSSGSGTDSYYNPNSANDYAMDYGGSPNPKNTPIDWATRQRNTTKYIPANLRSGAKNVDSGPNEGCGIASVLPLTNLRTAAKTKTVTDKLDTMVATGNTNVAMGAMWGWHMVSPVGPFAASAPADAKIAAYSDRKVTKVIVLLTDGDNVMSTNANPNNGTYSGYGYAAQKRLRNAYGTPLDETSNADQRRQAIDARQKLVCANAKEAGIVIYAIGVGVSSTSKAVLQDCASLPSDKHYFDVTAASQLDSVFNTIAGSIQNLRITK